MWPFRHKCIRANITGIEVPEEMSLLAELKTLTEHVHERCSGDLWRAADWRRTVQWREEGAQEQKNLIKRRAKKKQQRAGGEATGDTDADADADGPGRPGALEALCTTRLMGQRLFLLKKNDIVKEMQDAVRVYSELVTNRPEKRGRPCGCILLQCCGKRDFLSIRVRKSCKINAITFSTMKREVQSL